MNVLFKYAATHWELEKPSERTAFCQATIKKPLKNPPGSRVCLLYIGSSVQGYIIIGCFMIKAPEMQTDRIIKRRDFTNTGFCIFVSNSGTIFVKTAAGTSPHVPPEGAR